MPINYAQKLSPCADKGELGSPLRYDSPAVLKRKLDKLSEIVVRRSKWAVVTGAGISVPSGIPDFRSPTGIWTLEKEKKHIPTVDFDNAKPTYTHHAITALENKGLVKHLCSQNIDNLHLKAAFPRDRICEPHGNSFKSRCSRGHIKFGIEAFDSVGMKSLGTPCSEPGCRMRMRDTVLDWHQELEKEYYTMTEPHVKACDLLLVLGTSLQIRPVSTLPAVARHEGADVVIVTLQKLIRRNCLIIYAEADTVMRHIMGVLKMDVPETIVPFPIELSRHDPKDDDLTPLSQRAITN